MVLFFDLETTGLPTRRGAPYTDLAVWPRIVSVGWALLGDVGSEGKRRHAIVRPDGFAIPADAARVHGITTERALRDGAPLRDTLGLLLGDIEALKPELVVAHNIAFDRPVLLAVFLRTGLGDAFARLPCYCTMAGSTNLCRLVRADGSYKWPTLNELHLRLFGIGLERAHDAGADVISCAKCFFKLRDMGLAPAVLANR
jgi:DNA polymerase III epsilon subunit-like protein